MDGVLSDTFNPIFQNYFSYSPLFRCPATPQVWMELFTKSRNVYRFQSCLPIHFDTGLQLLPYLEIPEEIHKAIPSFYPGEFSTPLLEDELIFGDTLNPEHGQKEHPAGITIGELPSNILVGGQNLDQIVKNQCRIAIACQQHNLPMIIFDWSGNWMPYPSFPLHNPLWANQGMSKRVPISGSRFLISRIPHKARSRTTISKRCRKWCELAYHFNEGDLGIAPSIIITKRRWYPTNPDNHVSPNWCRFRARFQPPIGYDQSQARPIEIARLPYHVERTTVSSDSGYADGPMDRSQLFGR